MTNQRMRADATLRLNAYEVVARAVEEGVRYGLNRSRKHQDDPSWEAIEEHVTREVMNALSEVVRWGDE
jgi:hypothetical protein